MSRDLTHLPGEGEQPDPVAEFFDRERAGIRELPAGKDRWESIVVEATRPRRRHVLPYLAGAAAIVVVGGVVWGTGTGTGSGTDRAADPASHTSPVPTVTVTRTVGPKVVPPPTGGASSVPSTQSSTTTLPTPSTFDMVSMSNAGGGHLYALGAAKCGSADCTAVVASDDNGATWATRSSFTGLTTPGARTTPDRAHQLVGIRFANQQVGYVYGSTTKRTTDGGRHWTDVDVDRRTVLSLETDGQQVWMATATSCQHGTGPAPQGCLGLQVRSGAVNDPTTQPVTVPPTPSAVDYAWITMDGSDAYLNRASSAPMAPWRPIRVSGKPGKPGKPGNLTVPSGCSNDGMWLTGTANAPGTLVGVCPSAGKPTEEYSVAVSADRGSSWTTRPASELGRPRGTGLWLTAADAKHLVAIRQGIPSSGKQDERATVLTSQNGGVGWKPVDLGATTSPSWAGAAGGGLVYAIGGGLRYWVSHDSGATFESAPLRR
jgi:hypothetical protein